MTAACEARPGKGGQLQGPVTASLSLQGRSSFVFIERQDLCARLGPSVQRSDYLSIVVCTPHLCIYSTDNKPTPEGMCWLAVLGWAWL